MSKLGKKMSKIDQVNDSMSGYSTSRSPVNKCSMNIYLKFKKSRFAEHPIVHCDSCRMKPCCLNFISFCKKVLSFDPHIYPTESVNIFSSKYQSTRCVLQVIICSTFQRPCSLLTFLWWWQPIYWITFEANNWDPRLGNTKSWFLEIPPLNLHNHLFLTTIGIWIFNCISTKAPGILGSHIGRVVAGARRQRLVSKLPALEAQVLLAEVWQYNNHNFLEQETHVSKQTLPGHQLNGREKRRQERGRKENVKDKDWWGWGWGLVPAGVISGRRRHRMTSSEIFGMPSRSGKLNKYQTTTEKIRHPPTLL